MPARFHRIIHQQSQVLSFETFYSTPESLMIVLLSKYILNSSRHIHGVHQTVAGKCSHYLTL